MKVINEKDYQYLGIKDGWFIYSKRLGGNQVDEELTLVKRCTFIRQDGSRQIYDISRHEYPIVFVPKVKMKRDYPSMKISLHDSAVKSYS